MEILLPSLKTIARDQRTLYARFPESHEPRVIQHPTDRARAGGVFGVVR